MHWFGMDQRIGYCCTYVSPSGDEAEARLLNMRGPTIASVARPGGSETAARLEAVVAENLDILDRQIAAVAALPKLERMFRIQSGFLIGWSHPLLQEAWTPTLRGEVERRLAGTGAAARAGDVRLSMHPAQHAILATVNPGVLDNALRDISEHHEIFAMMGFSGWHPHGASINIHGGSRAAGVEGLNAGLDQVPSGALDLLTIENDENSFGIDDLLRVGERVAIVLDFHHHWIFTAGEWLQPGDPRVDAIESSWRGVRPLAHISVSRENVIGVEDPDRLPDVTSLAGAGHKASKLRGHSDGMWNKAVNDFVAAHLAWCDIEVEAKAKNLASRELADHVRAMALT
jgi:UV DNA damage repair endonuclease